MNFTEVPDNLAEAIRAAASALPPTSSDVDGVRRRGRARIRHRAIGATGLVGVAVAATLVVPSVLTGPGAAPEAAPDSGAAASGPAPSAAAAVPAQRLLIGGGSGMLRVREPDGLPVGENEVDVRDLYQRYRDDPDAYGVLGGYAEVLPDGDVVGLDFRHLNPAGVDVRDLTALPDGRLALINVVDRMPGVERTDGPCVEGLEYLLQVVEADGAVGLTRDVRVRCGTVRLVAVDAQTAYLVRDGELVTHDLATGAERAVPGLSGLRPDQGVSVAAGRVAAVAGPRPECGGDRDRGELSLRWAETGGGQVVEVPLPGCGPTRGPVRLSPDGRYAAVAFHRLDRDTDQLRVGIIDLDRAELVEDRLITQVAGGQRAGGTGPHGISRKGGEVVGMAWSDDATLRVGWYEAPADGVHWLADLVRVETIPLP